MKKAPATTPLTIFGADLLLRHLDAMMAEVPGVQEATDIEYIHRMRVASRRLRNALPVFLPALSQCSSSQAISADQTTPFGSSGDPESRTFSPALTKKMAAWGKEIRRITRSLGAARDLDVQLEELRKFLQQNRSTSQWIPGVRRLILRLEQERSVRQVDVLKAVEHFVNSRLADKIHRLLDPLASLQDPASPPHADLFHLASQAIQQRLDEFFKRQDALQNPENLEELHAQRITAKHLRYTLEIFSPLFSNQLQPYISTCRKIQDQLGMLHDCDVWISLLPEFFSAEKQRTVDFFGKPDAFNLLLPGLLAFQADRMALRNEMYTAFITGWNAALRNGLWNELKSQLAEVLLPSRLYPPHPNSPVHPQVPQPQE